MSLSPNPLFWSFFLFWDQMINTMSLAPRPRTLSFIGNGFWGQFFTKQEVFVCFSVKCSLKLKFFDRGMQFLPLVGKPSSFFPFTRGDNSYQFICSPFDVPFSGGYV